MGGRRLPLHCSTSGVAPSAVHMALCMFAWVRACELADPAVLALDSKQEHHHCCGASLCGMTAPVRCAVVRCARQCFAVQGPHKTTRFVRPPARPVCATSRTPSLCDPLHAWFVRPLARLFCATSRTPVLCDLSHARFVRPLARPVCATPRTPGLCNPLHARFVRPLARKQARPAAEGARAERFAQRLLCLTRAPFWT